MYRAAVQLARDASVEELLGNLETYVIQHKRFLNLYVIKKIMIDNDIFWCHYHFLHVLKNMLEVVMMFEVVLHVFLSMVFPMTTFSW